MMTIELERTHVRAGTKLNGVVRRSNGGELVLMWRTEGKGDEDSEVVHREVITSDEHRFSALLPLLPCSYDGAIVKIRWLAVVRNGGMVDDTSFVVG